MFHEVFNQFIITVKLPFIFRLCGGCNEKHELREREQVPSKLHHLFLGTSTFTCFRFVSSFSFGLNYPFPLFLRMTKFLNLMYKVSV